MVRAIIDAGADVNVTDQDKLTPLFCAAQNNNGESMVSALINSGADVKAIDQDGVTPFFYAASFDDESMVRALIDAGADVNVTDQDEQTPLFYAAKKSNGESMVCALINAGADVNATDQAGETALFYAAENNNGLSMVRALINADAYVNITDQTGKTPLFYAAENINGESMVRALINAGADVNAPDQDGKPPLLNAVVFDDESMVRALINAGADVNATDQDGETPLFYAARNNNGESIVRALIDDGADVNATDQDKQTPLFYAAKNDEGESMVRALIDAGADVNITDQDGKTPLFYAVYSCDESTVRALLDAGADVNITDQDGKTPLFYAVVNSEDGCMIYQTLVKDGQADVHIRDRYGRTLLFYALLNSSECARYLLDNGAKLDLRDNCNLNMLSFSIENRGLHQLKLVHGDINFFLEQGVTKETVFQSIVNVMFCKAIRFPIESLVSKGLNTASDYLGDENVEKQCLIENMIEIVKQKDTTFIYKLSKMLYLLNKLGADPNYADEDGNTALHYATRLAFQNVEDGKVLDILNQLKVYGANPHARNHENITPLLFCLSEEVWKTACSNNICSGAKTQVEVCRFLLKYGSSVNKKTRDGESVIHLTMNLIGRYIELDDREKVHEAINILQLFSSHISAKHLTINQFDVYFNSPLHTWASLGYSGPITEDLNIEGLLLTTLKSLMECGVKLYARNADDRTPLHLCQTWTAAKLLLENRANPNDVDSSQCSPLLAAANENTFLKKTGCFYPDVTENPTIFWKTALDKKLDPWTANKDGQCVLAILLESEEFVLAKALLEVICEEKYSVSDAITVSLLNTICKDKSPRTLWKNNLVEMLLNSKKNPLNVDESLRICCSNIMASLKRNSSFKKAENDEPSGSNNETEESSSVHVERNLELYDSVYCEIATQLCLYVGEKTCLKIAKEYVNLKEFLTRPVDLEKVKIVIPWTSVSTVHRPKLAKVARRLDCKMVEQFWLHNEHFASGRFGDVFAGISEKEGREVAVKRIVNSRMQRPEDKREIRNLTALADCEQVVRYLAFIEEGEFSYVVLELMEGSLEDYFTQAFDTAKSIVLCQDVVMGLQYLHGKGYVHRDLKPSNILYKTYPKLCLKIADLGLSRNISSKSTTTVYSTKAGTRCWMAPELLQSSVDHTKASDIFTCGLVLHFILSQQKHPFSPKKSGKKSSKSEMAIVHDTESNVKSNNTEGWDNSLIPEATHLIRSLIESDNTKRPSAAEGLAHPMFWSQKKKVDFLTAVGNQPEFGYSRSGKVVVLGVVETDLENQVGIIVKYGNWNDTRYLPMPTIFIEMRKRRKYDTQSAVELVRFIRNAYEHVSDSKRPPPFKKQLLGDFVFFHEFPHLIMEVYKVVTAHGWHQSRDEVKYKLNN